MRNTLSVDIVLVSFVATPGQAGWMEVFKGEGSLTKEMGRTL